MKTTVQLVGEVLPTAEIMFDGVLKVGTGVSVQELLNAFMDLTDGEDAGDLMSRGMSEDEADRYLVMRESLKGHWTYGVDGAKVIG